VGLRNANQSEKWYESVQILLINFCALKCCSLVSLILINGPADSISGIEIARKYQQIIPKPNVIILDDSISHYPHIEVPDKVFDAYSIAYKFVVATILQKCFSSVAFSQVMLLIFAIYL
jgi:hypothetical protein